MSGIPHNRPLHVRSTNRGLQQSERRQKHSHIIGLILVWLYQAVDQQKGCESQAQGERQNVLLAGARHRIKENDNDQAPSDLCSGNRVCEWNHVPQTFSVYPRCPPINIGQERCKSATATTITCTPLNAATFFLKGHTVRENSHLHLCVHASQSAFTHHKRSMYVQEEKLSAKHRQ